MPFKKFVPIPTAFAGKSTSDLVDVNFQALKAALDTWFYGVVNVRDIGAVGDGIRDDTLAFKQAFTEAASNSKAVYIPAGTYIISDQITASPASSFTVYGDGTQSTTIIFTADAQGFYITIPLR